MESSRVSCPYCDELPPPVPRRLAVLAPGPRPRAAPPGHSPTAQGSVAVPQRRGGSGAELGEAPL